MIIKLILKTLQVEINGDMPAKYNLVKEHDFFFSLNATTHCFSPCEITGEKYQTTILFSHPNISISSP